MSLSCYRYRILAELLDTASSTLTIPTYLPTFPIQPSTPPTQPTQPPTLEPSRPTGVNPSNALQHPGFYYYTAAMCTERRLERFNAADQEALNLSAGSVPTNLMNERKVDHKVIILEVYSICLTNFISEFLTLLPQHQLYTKAYELFKKHNHGQGQIRLTFHIACRIAQTYRDSGKFDMAIRFFERIARTYRKERWGAMLKPILSMWYACTRQLGDVDGSVRLLIEMICSGTRRYVAFVCRLVLNRK